MDEQQQLLSASRIEDRIVVTVQGDFVGANLHRLQTSLLDRLKDGKVRTVIFDVSTVEVMDLTEFQSFANVVRMTELLGISAVIVGINPGVAAFLAESGARIGGLKTALGIDDVNCAIHIREKAN